MKFNNFKIRSTYSVLLILVVTFLVNCNPCPPKTEVFAKKESTKYFSFFKEDLRDSEGKKVFAEVSAVTFDGTNLIFGNEDSIRIDPKYPNKTDPQKFQSPIFKIPLKSFPPSDVNDFEKANHTIFKNARKFEDMTIISGESAEEYVVATTAFDREKISDTTKFDYFDSFNVLLYWPKGKPDQVKMVDEFERNGYKSSMAIRKALFKTLGLSEDKYYKVEGLASIPNNKLLFGIRQVGASFKKNDNHYTITIISANYKINQGNLTLNNFQIVFELNPKTIRNKTDWNTVGLSSLEYDKYNNRLYMLTSFENGESTYEDIGAYLWVLSVDNNTLISDPVMVIDKKTSKPLVFNHKAEGIAMISATELFIVHDDDEIVNSQGPNGKEQLRRKPHQTAYTKVKIVN